MTSSEHVALPRQQPVLPSYLPLLTCLGLHSAAPRWRLVCVHLDLAKEDLDPWMTLGKGAAIASEYVA